MKRQVTLLCSLLSLVAVQVVAQQASKKATLVLPGVYVCEGSVTDSINKKGNSNFQLLFISGSDTVRLTSNARGSLSQQACPRLQGSPDSIRIVCATNGYHITQTTIKVMEYGKSPDENGVEVPWYNIEINVMVAKD